MDVPQKKDGRPRLYIDHRALNKQQKADKLPMPIIENTLDGMAKEEVFTKKDLFAGYLLKI